MTPLAKLCEGHAFAYLVERNQDRLDPPPPSAYIAATEEHFAKAIRRAVSDERHRLDAIGWCPELWADLQPESASEADERHEAECAAADRAYDRERAT